MSGPEQTDEAPRNTKVDEFVENTISSVVEFGLRYLITIWTFLRWPFKRSLGILQPSEQSRISKPLSFLFVSSSFFYIASELFIKMTQIGGKWKPNPDDLSPFSDIPWNTYTLEAFALYTAPIIAIVIVLAKICGWALSKDPATQSHTRAMVQYISGYILLMLSVVIFTLVLAVAEIVSEIAIPGHVDTGAGHFTGTHLYHFLQYFLYAFLIYLFVSILVVFGSFSRASAFWETTRRFARYAIVRFLIVCTIIILFMPAGIAGTSFLILKNMRSAPDIELSGVMVIKKDANALARQELPISLAVTNTSEKTMVLFTFKRMTARLRTDEKPKQELEYLFKPKSTSGEFIELQPHGVVIIDGMLVKHDAQREAWLEDNSQKSKLSITLSLVGGYQKEQPFGVYNVSAANYWKNGYRHGGLFFTGFTK